MNVLQLTLVTTLGTLVGAPKLFCEECWDPNQEKAKCVGWQLYEDTCEGVPFIRCKPKYCKCHCLPGYYRRWDYQCVKSQTECYPNTASPEHWLKNTDDLYIKYMSGYQQKWYPYKCFKSKYKSAKGNTFYRNVEFLMSYKKENSI
uniref:Putative secreted protein n=1 Tax=Amblyomma cajennense TaxID=34607 RepID=A0A023FCD2_AMBCJ